MGGATFVLLFNLPYSCEALVLKFQNRLWEVPFWQMYLSSWPQHQCCWKSWPVHLIHHLHVSFLTLLPPLLVLGILCWYPLFCASPHLYWRKCHDSFIDEIWTMHGNRIYRIRRCDAKMWRKKSTQWIGPFDMFSTQVLLISVKFTCNKFKGGEKGST